jgi:hypothetical protein
LNSTLKSLLFWVLLVVLGMLIWTYSSSWTGGGAAGTGNAPGRTQSVAARSSSTEPLLETRATPVGLPAGSRQKDTTTSPRVRNRRAASG